jgi:hypothetical protein
MPAPQHNIFPARQEPKAGRKSQDKDFD